MLLKIEKKCTFFISTITWCCSWYDVFEFVVVVAFCDITRRGSNECSSMVCSCCFNITLSGDRLLLLLLWRWRWRWWRLICHLQEICQCTHIALCFEQTFASIAWCLLVEDRRQMFDEKSTWYDTNDNSSIRYADEQFQRWTYEIIWNDKKN